MQCLGVSAVGTDIGVADSAGCVLPGVGRCCEDLGLELLLLVLLVLLLALLLLFCCYSYFSY